MTQLVWFSRMLFPEDLPTMLQTFLERNPQLVPLMAEIVGELQANGCAQGGIDWVTSIARYRLILKGDGSGYKLNNNWRPYLARVLCQEHRHCRSFFRFRKAAADV